MNRNTIPHPAHEILRTLASRALSLEPAPRGVAISATLERMAAAVTPHPIAGEVVRIVPADLAAGLKRLAGTWHPDGCYAAVPTSDEPAVVARRATLSQLADLLECADLPSDTYLSSTARLWTAIVGRQNEIGVRRSKLVDEVAPRREAMLATLTRELGEMESLIVADENDRSVAWSPPC